MEQLSLFGLSIKYKNIVINHEVVIQKAPKKTKSYLLHKNLDEVRYRGKLLGYVSIGKGKNSPYSYSWQDADLQGGQCGPANSIDELEQWVNRKIEWAIGLLK